ncbi:hypothetical protein N0B51_01715 [Tsuneonella sp. YG55]|uniref:Uncharacterized protein n=1 Tax=Tsuneonella litorea TaxID=2976475 RepID=A0A9X2VYK5_9SPHN|nr:hypothetical protein [Tsuneonella litorea]MCT2557690.1 hypothetical protein [Tsuneonella litorea]
MLHGFFEEGDWFAAKRFGYGAGLPIAWQGWVVLLVYLGIVAGAGLLAGADPDVGPLVAGLVIAVATTALILIARRRTRGGWRWRWGEQPDRNP